MMKVLVICSLVWNFYPTEGVSDGNSLTSIMSKLLENTESSDSIKTKVAILETKMEFLNDAKSSNSLLNRVLDNMSEEIENLKIYRKTDTNTLEELVETVAALKETIRKPRVLNETSTSNITTEEEDPCAPSPWQCTSIQGTALCSCGVWGLGNTPGTCDYECDNSNGCVSNETCINNKCLQCTEICGTGSECNTQDHMPTCACPQGFEGDPLVMCNETSPREPCTTGFVEIEKTCYYFSNVTKTQPDAAAACRSLSSSLLTVDSVHENELIKQHLNSIEGDFWNSLKLVGQVWKWGTGTVMTFDYFTSSEPQAGDDCTVYKKASEWLWAGRVCKSTPYKYICKM